MALVTSLLAWILKNHPTSGLLNKFSRTEYKSKTPLAIGFSWLFYGVSHGKLEFQVIKGSA